MCVQSFHSRQGKAYLFNAVVNVLEGPKEERLMTTGKLLCHSAFCAALELIRPTPYAVICEPEQSEHLA